MRKHFLKLSALAVIFAFASCCDNGNNAQVPESNAADVVVYGNVFTADKKETMAEAFAVKDGKFVCVGTRAEMTKYINDGKTKVVDYTGKGLIIPGCTEGHGHFIGLDGVARMLPGYREPYSKLVGSIISEKMKTNPEGTEKPS